MSYRFDEVPVDSGIIVIADKDYYKPYGPKEAPAYEEKLEVGEYAARWEMPETWNGKVSGKGSLSITSGILWVSDPCYIIAHDKWEDYLKKWIWPKKGKAGHHVPNEGVLVLDKHGGDGSFQVLLNLTPVMPLTDVHGNIIYCECRRCKTYSFEEVINGLCTEWCEEVLLNHEKDFPACGSCPVIGNVCDDNPNLSTIITDKGVFQGTVKDLKLFGKHKEA